jgi:hypothetical protein
MSNVYGPRQDPEAETGVIAIFCGILAVGGRATVYGSGRQTRDYLFVDDAAAAWLAAADSDITGALNVSSGIETSVLDVAGALDLDYDLAPGRPGEIQHSCLDASAAARRLDWAAGCRWPTGCAVRSTRSGPSGRESRTTGGDERRRGAPNRAWLAATRPAWQRGSARREPRATWRQHGVGISPRLTTALGTLTR